MSQIVDYGWKEPQTCAHSYLFDSIKFAFKAFSLSESAQILDAGCGGGNIVQKLYGENYENIWGFDVSESGINVAKSNYKEISNRFEVHNSYNRTLPDSFPGSNYDLVLSVEVMEHLFSPKDYLDNVNLWLKDEGLLVLTTPFHGYLKNLLIALTNKFDSHVNPLWEGGHIKFYSKKTMYALLRNSGFKPLKFYGSGRMPYLWKSMIVVARKI